MADSGLMRALTATATEAELFARVVELGRLNGIELTIAELEEIARVIRRAWLERWVPGE